MEVSVADVNQKKEEVKNTLAERLKEIMLMKVAQEKDRIMNAEAIEKHKS